MNVKLSIFLLKKRDLTLSGLGFFKMFSDSKKSSKRTNSQLYESQVFDKQFDVKPVQSDCFIDYGTKSRKSSFDSEDSFSK